MARAAGRKRTDRIEPAVSGPVAQVLGPILETLEEVALGDLSHFPLHLLAVHDHGELLDLFALAALVVDDLAPHPPEGPGQGAQFVLPIGRGGRGRRRTPMC
jgi:hypothetical protein